jgi:hypothetical protein
VTSPLPVEERVMTAIKVRLTARALSASLNKEQVTCTDYTILYRTNNRLHITRAAGATITGPGSDRAR